MIGDPSYQDIRKKLEALPDAALMRIAGPRSIDYAAQEVRAARNILVKRKAGLVAFRVYEPRERAKMKARPRSTAEIAIGAALVVVTLTVAVVVGLHDAFGLFVGALAPVGLYLWAVVRLRYSTHERGQWFERLIRPDDIMLGEVRGISFIYRPYRAMPN